MQKGCNHISTLQSDQKSTGLFQNCLKESPCRPPPPPLFCLVVKGKQFKKKKKSCLK